MNDRTNKTTAEAEIYELMDSWLSAVRANDLKGIASHYAQDILAFDAIAQLQFKGKEAYIKHWEACLAMCPGTMLFEIRDLNVAGAGDVGFGHYLCHCGAKDENGEEKASWMRVTVGCRKRNGKWLIVHEHFSAPFDMESGKALFDLKP